MTPDGPHVERYRDDRGSASIWLLGVGLATVLAALAVATAAGVLVARQRAQAAADLGALAGARHALAGEATACGYAARIVEANDAIMQRCRLTGLDLTITVSAATSGPDGALPARADARAGPARAGPGTARAGAGTPNNIGEVVAKGGADDDNFPEVATTFRGGGTLGARRARGDPGGNVAGRSGRWLDSRRGCRACRAATTR